MDDGWVAYVIHGVGDDMSADVGDVLCDCVTLHFYRIATANYANSYWGGYSSPWWDYFNTYGGVPMELSANQSYLLRGVLKEAYGLDYLRVSI